MRQRIKGVLAEILGVEPADIEEESLLREDLGLGGAEMTELLERVKEEFNTELSPQDVGDVETVGEFLDLLESYVQEEL